jgi:hypothetical protein
LSKKATFFWFLTRLDLEVGKIDKTKNIVMDVFDDMVVFRGPVREEEEVC